MLDLLLPQRCVACGSGGAQLCDGCRTRLPRIMPPLCERCGIGTEWPVRRCRECAGRRLAFVSARSAVEYDAAVRAVVAAWKERGMRRLAELAGDVVVDVLEPPKAEALTFVPPDRTRELKRGHHAAAALAEQLATRWGLPVEPLLVRTRPRPPQRGLDLARRRRNVAGAFEPCGVVPRRVVLVDDVFTTGATANAAASALRRGGGRRVDVVTFARAIRLR